ncbi:hypothetical protein OG943_14700 [Amycolatopsis sp. NBC_00345]|uniref:HAAS signaling domain-containing protein n=1 Tax=Amycolatopsis sp. NBC_00345 TaxID=2975955 RepID=UPI002E26149E
MNAEPTTTSLVRSEPLSTTDALITDYLDRLRRAGAGLPAATRAELLDDIAAHLAELVGPGADEARARQVLDELGTPEEIAAAAAAESGAPAGASAGGPAGGPARAGGGELAYDVGTVLVLLLAGFVVPVLGWIAGVVMLWNGPRWSTGEKWAGTLIWPAAIVVTGMVLGLAHALAGGVGPVVLLLGAIVVLAGLVAGFAVLLRAAARRRA